MRVMDTRMNGVKRIRVYKCFACKDKGVASENVYTVEEPCTEYTFKKEYNEWTKMSRFWEDR